jgi:TonB family protein
MKYFLSLFAALLLTTFASADNVNPSTGYLKNPELVAITKPAYPSFALDRRVQGRVIVNVTLDEAGKPIDAKVVKSSSIAFESAALTAALKATYKPALGLHGPVKSVVQVPFSFTIK